MKLIISLTAAVIMFSGINSQAKDSSKERSPNQVSTNFGKKIGVTVKARNLKEALEKISKNQKVKAILKATNKQLKDNAAAQLELNFDSDKAMSVVSGKSGSDFYVKHMVPLYGLVEGTGNISAAFLLAQIDENSNIVNMEDENSLKSYTFSGFLKVKALNISDKDQTSGFSID